MRVARMAPRDALRAAQGCWSIVPRVDCPTTDRPPQRLASMHYGQTFLHPAALALTLAMGVFLLRSSRYQAVVPFVVVACLLPEIQRIVVLGQNFTMIRVLVLFGLMKISTTRERARFRFTRLDLLFSGWLVANLLVYTLREGSLSALSNRLGYTFEGVGVYLVFRVMLVDGADVLRAIRMLAWIAIPMGALMVLENQTGRNLFSALGGVPEFTTVREGRLRAQGAFSHAIMAGSFGASLFPLFVALLLMAPRGRRLVPTVSLVASALVTVLSASAGPLVALVAGVGAWMLYPLRAQMSLIRWGVVAALVVIHFLRDAPVWQLIGRLGSLTGGTGYHRYRLIDAFINRFGEWWLLGTTSTLNWFVLNSDDLTNQYVLEGVRGGLLSLGLFVAMLVSAFSALGRVRKRALRVEGLGPRQKRAVSYLAWGLGATLTVHCVSFISVAYFGQMLSILHMHLAMIASFCAQPVPLATAVPSAATSGESIRTDPVHQYR